MQHLVVTRAIFAHLRLRVSPDLYYAFMGLTFQIGGKISAPTQLQPETSLKRIFRKSMNTRTLVGMCCRLGNTAKISRTVGW